MSDTLTIAIPERFDFNSHKTFNTQCESALREKEIKRIVLDFSRAGYVDSSALGMMVLLHRKATPLGKQLSIRGARGTAKDVLEIANIQRLYAYE